MSAAGLRIGALSRATDVSIDTIRYYERVGLLPKAPRQRSGYRLFDASIVLRLALIRDARHLGFSLEAIRELLGVLDDPRADDAARRRVAQRHLGEIDARLAELTALRERFVRALTAPLESGKPVASTGVIAARRPAP